MDMEKMFVDNYKNINDIEVNEKEERTVNAQFTG